MKNTSLIALAAALIGLSGCVAYPMGDYGGERDRGGDHDRNHRDDRHGDDRDRDRDHHPDCDSRTSDCPHH